MKKFFCVFSLVAALMASLCVPAFAAGGELLYLALDSAGNHYFFDSDTDSASLVQVDKAWCDATYPDHGVTSFVHTESDCQVCSFVPSLGLTPVVVSDVVVGKDVCACLSLGSSLTMYNDGSVHCVKCNACGRYSLLSSVFLITGNSSDFIAAVESHSGSDCAFCFSLEADNGVVFWDPIDPSSGSGVSGSPVTPADPGSVLGSIDAIFTAAMGWAGSVAETVVEIPLLLLGVIIGFIGLGVGLFRRLLF